MNRYFFDIVTSAGVQHDFQGRSLSRPEDARDLAEMIALDLECSDKEWTNTDVVVRDVCAVQLYSIGVRHPDLIPA